MLDLILISGILESVIATLPAADCFAAIQAIRDIGLDAVCVPPPDMRLPEA